MYNYDVSPTDPRSQIRSVKPIEITLGVFWLKSLDILGNTEANHAVMMTHHNWKIFHFFSLMYFFLFFNFDPRWKNKIMIENIYSFFLLNGSYGMESSNYLSSLFCCVQKTSTHEWGFPLSMWIYEWNRFFYFYFNLERNEGLSNIHWVVETLK